MKRAFILMLPILLVSCKIENKVTIPDYVGTLVNIDYHQGWFMHDDTSTVKTTEGIYQVKGSISGKIGDKVVLYESELCEHGKLCIKARCRCIK